MQNGNRQPIKKGSTQKKTSGILSNIYTGPAKTHPGVLKAQADKAKRDSVLSDYKKKSDAQKLMAIKKAGGKK